jgi:transcriptional regulator GlxA family with amidase domain
MDLALAILEKDLDATSDGVQTALAYAKEHLSATLCVDTLAKAAFLSPRQFSRLFREETGRSPAKAIESRTDAAFLHSGIWPVATDTSTHSKRFGPVRG